LLLSEAFLDFMHFLNNFFFQVHGHFLSFRILFLSLSDCVSELGAGSELSLQFNCFLPEWFVFIWANQNAINKLHFAAIFLGKQNGEAVR